MLLSSSKGVWTATQPYVWLTSATSRSRMHARAKAREASWQQRQSTRLRPCARSAIARGRIGGEQASARTRADAVGGRKSAAAVHLLCCSDFTAAKSAARRRIEPTASSRTKLESWSSCSLPSTSCTGSTAKLPKARRFLGTPRRRQSPSVTCLRHFAVHRGVRDFLLQAQALVTCEKE